MPELPEVETVCRGLAVKLIGQTIHHVILHRSGLRQPFPVDFAQNVTGAKVTAITRRSKYALIHLSNKGVIILHLGMSGRVSFVDAKTKPAKHDHAVFQFGSAKQKQGSWEQLFFNDARRFGVLDYTTEKHLDAHPLLASLGLDPFAPEFTGAWLFERLSMRKVPMKNALMDQGIIAGLGNIYVCEALFRAKIHPMRVSNKVIKAEAGKLVTAIRAVLTKAIDAGGSTLRDYMHTDGGIGYFQTSFKVYGREDEPCTRCRTPIERIVQSGRSTFFCPICQT